MKMDHHCPWTGNCIGLLNHKKFWLFLFYSAIGLLIMGIFLKQRVNEHDFANTMTASFACAGSITILLIIHTVYILNYWSTLEAGALYGDNIFKSMSYGEAWRKVFGNNALLWMLPCGSPDPLEGLDYGADCIPKGVVHQINS